MNREITLETQFLAAVERRREVERAARNEQLRAHLARNRTFEELLSELSSLKGFNVEERRAVSA